jgi:hypothetical protein
MICLLQPHQNHRMKSIFTLISLLSFSILHAQDATLTWARIMGGSDVEEGRSIAVDASGNVYTTGSFRNTADFNPDPAVTYNLTPFGSLDVFVSKLDASGNFVWAKQLGGIGGEGGVAITVDAAGNVYTTGSFNRAADFNPDPAVTNTLTPSGFNDDIFISKLDAAGNYVWAKQLGGSAVDYSAAITVDALGNVYTTGVFFGTADFNPGAATFNLTSAGGNDIFVSKLDASGNFVWAKQFGGTSADQPLSIAVDASGNVLTTGFFNGTADFNPDPAVTFNLTEANSDAFVSKLNAAGDFVWAKQLGGASQTQGNAIAVDATGNVYTTGLFTGTGDFNPDPAVNNNLTSVGTSDIFISKLDAAGNYVWAQRIGGSVNPGENSHAIVLDATGNIYTTGSFRGVVDFNPDPAVTNNLTAVGSPDVFVSKLDAAGNYLWAKQMGGSSETVGYSIAVDASANVYVSGFLSGTADFDPNPAVTNNLTSAGEYDIFVLKLSQPGILPIHFSSVKAFQKNTGVQVEWNIATESNIHIYEVEKSSDGIHFTKAGHFAPTSNNNASVSYHWLDNNPYDGNTFYRLKAVEISGSFKYSSIVSINISKGRSSIVINPNPVIDGVINLQLQNQPRGTYNVRLFNSAGQLMYSTKVQHQGGSSVQTIRLDNKIAGGIYQLHVTNGLTRTMHKVVL